MDHLFARMKGRIEKYEKILSGKTIYEKPEDIENAVEYDVDYKLEEDEWYAVKSLSKKDFCLQFLGEPIDSTTYAQMKKGDINQIQYLCAYQSGNEFYFQRAMESRIMRKQKFLDCSGDFKIEETGQGIIINKIPDAIYLRERDILYFKKLETISPIFKGIDKLYREATREEVEKFLDKKFIKLGNNYNVNRVGKANRKRIALAMDTLVKLNKTEKKELFIYTNDYFPGLKYNGKTFEINNEEDLKKLLYGIEQRCYTTPITNEKRVANSVYKLE